MTTTRPPVPAARRPLRGLALVVGAALLAASGCGNYAPEDQSFFRAVPRLADVAFQPPGAEIEADDAQAGEVQQALSSCDEAPLRCEAERTATAFNDMTAGLLLIVDGVINLTTFKRYPNRRVWGPHYLGDNNPFTFRFELERVEDADAEHAYRYCLHVVPGDHDDWRLNDPVNCDVDVDLETGLTRVLWGSLTPGDEVLAQAGSGAGQLVFDGNTLRHLGGDDNVPPARFDITYDHFGGSDLIDLTISDVIDEESGVFTSAAYHYAKLASGAGDFFFTIKADVNPGQILPPPLPPVLETYEILAQWDANRAGSARAAVYGGDLITGIESSRWDIFECWDGELDTVFLEHPDLNVENVGTEAACSVPVPAAL